MVDIECSNLCSDFFGEHTTILGVIKWKITTYYAARWSKSCPNKISCVRESFFFIVNQLETTTISLVSSYLICLNMSALSRHNENMVDFFKNCELILRHSKVMANCKALLLYLHETEHSCMYMEYV